MIKILLLFNATFKNFSDLLCSLKILHNECRIIQSLNFTSKRTYSKIIREICSGYKTQALSTFICVYLSPKYKGRVI